MAKFGAKFLDFIGLGGNDEDDEEEEYYEEDEAPVRRQTKTRATKEREPEFEEDEEFVPQRQPREAQPARQQAQPQTSAARRTSSTSGQRIQTAQGAGFPTTSSSKMIVYHPVSYEDTQNIVNSMCNGKPVIVNMEELEIDTAQRILDFLSGAVFAVKGTMSKISRGIFIVAPEGCDVISNDEQETPDL